MAQVAHRAKVEHRRVAVLPDPPGELPCDGEHGGRVVAVDPLDGQLGPPVERLLDPALGAAAATDRGVAGDPGESVGAVVSVIWAAIYTDDPRPTFQPRLLHGWATYPPGGGRWRL
jgi:hypothetical protein